MTVVSSNEILLSIFGSSTSAATLQIVTWQNLQSTQFHSQCFGSNAIPQRTVCYGTLVLIHSTRRLIPTDGIQTVCLVEMASSIRGDLAQLSSQLTCICGRVIDISKIGWVHRTFSCYNYLSCGLIFLDLFIVGGFRLK